MALVNAIAFVIMKLLHNLVFMPKSLILINVDVSIILKNIQAVDRFIFNLFL